MIPTGLFNVCGFSCYVGSPNEHTATVVLEGCFPLLQAEYAASTVARALKCNSITLEWVKGTTRYGCKLNDVPIKELEKWQD